MSGAQEDARLMRRFSRRSLTSGEIALGRTVFGDEIGWGEARIAQGPPAPFGAMVPFGRTILFAGWRAPADFAQETPAEQGWFVHELAHVWQAARGRCLACAKLRALGRRAYHVHWFPGAQLRDFNIEAQAEIARFLFLARSGEPAPLALSELERLWDTRFNLPHRQRV